MYKIYFLYFFKHHAYIALNRFYSMNTFKFLTGDDSFNHHTRKNIFRLLEEDLDECPIYIC